MATVVNFIDTTLQSASSRALNLPNAAVLLSASTNAFHINNAGANDPASITFTGSRIAIEGVISFACTGGTLTVSGDVATLTYANMSAATASVTASITANGATITSNACVVSKVLDGATGATGARGAGQFYGTGSSWSDTTADAATPGSNVTDDLVTISNGSTFAETRRWNGSAWVAITAVFDPALLINGALTTAKFASTIEPVTLVTSVPGTKSTYSIFNTTDGKLYRWNGTAYVATVASSDLSGTIADTQIVGMAASKVTGTLTNAQLADIAAAKVTGTLSDTQLAAIAAAKVTGQIVSTQITDGSIATAKLAANAVTAAKILAGTITSNEIAATTITGANIAGTTITGAKMVAGTVTANEIAALTITAANIAGGTITGAKMVAGTVTANEIAATTITAGNIAGLTITAAQMASDSITAGKIAAAAISAREIAAGAITAGKLAVGDFENLAANPSGYLNGVVTADGWSGPSAGKAAQFSVTSEPYLFFTTRNNSTGTFFRVTPGDQFYFEFTSIPSGGGAGDVNIGLGLVARGTDPDSSSGDTFPIGAVRSAAAFGVQTLSGTYTIPAGVYWAQVYVLVSTVTSSAGFYLKNIQVRRMSGSTLIQDGAITTNKILAGAVTANEIAANTITAAKIASSTITATEIAAGAITSTKINVASLDAVSSVLGSVEISTTGSLRSGQTAYNTGNGFWAGLVSGTAKLSFGNSSGSNIRWDGSALTVSGQIISNGNLTTGAAHTADVFSSSFTTTVPFVMPRTGTVIIKARVNPAAGDKAGFKLYNEGTVGSPGTVAATSEHYEAGLGTTAVDVWISQPLTAGNYWLGPSNASYAVLSAFVIKVLA